MTTLADKLNALAARCEAAEGPCIGLDADIELVVGNWASEHHEAWARFQECGEAVNPPMCEPVGPRGLTASIDAALTLVGDVSWRVEDHPLAGPCAIVDDQEGYAATPALALAAAALRARATQGENQ